MVRPTRGRHLNPVSRDGETSSGRGKGEYSRQREQPMQRAAWLLALRILTAPFTSPRSVIIPGECIICTSPRESTRGRAERGAAGRRYRFRMRTQWCSVGLGGPCWTRPGGRDGGEARRPCRWGSCPTRPPPGGLCACGRAAQDRRAPDPGCSRHPGPAPPTREAPPE